MRYALLSDIHANWEALERALEFLENARIDRIAVLGDTIGYGADPEACFNWAVQNADILLLGNHEKAIFDVSLRDWFNPAARKAIEWTEKNVSPQLKGKIQELAYTQSENNLFFAHSSPDSPEEFRYLMNYSDAEPSFQAFQEPVCFVGHTHVPACFNMEKCSGEYLCPGIFQIRGKTILNPGSVGQPRDQDPRLSLGIYESGEHSFELVRLEYDNRKAADKIRKAGLPQSLAARIL